MSSTVLEVRSDSMDSIVLEANSITDQEDDRVNDRLLTEHDRQRKYLASLPTKYEFPLFNARQALEAQRRSGYRNTASASREIVDNSIEAGADRVHVVFDLDREAGRSQVRAIAFIDNGPGMVDFVDDGGEKRSMARFALSWGGGTHMDDPAFIGKFGFGLPNASINQARTTEVYTRTSLDHKFTKAWLNIDEYPPYGIQVVKEPIEADLPTFVQRYIERNRFSLEHGTVVVWSIPDRLTYKTPSLLKEHLIEDFGVVYRYLLVDTERTLELIVEGMRVQPVDPLFLMPEARFYLPPAQNEKGEYLKDDAPTEGGARLMHDLLVPVSYYQDPDTGERHLQRLEDKDEVKDGPGVLAIGTINVRIVRLPIGFLEHQKGKEKTDAGRRFEVRQSRRGMSFVRCGRELETWDAFPRSPKDKASGLGDWPLLQSYAYYWGVEVRFQPELDDVFSITNDKQGVRPIEDFWRVLESAGVADYLNRENAWQSVWRSKLNKEKQASAISSDSGPSPAERAAQRADSAEGRAPSVPTHLLSEANEGLESEAKRRVSVGKESLEEARAAIETEGKRQAYRIDFYDSEDGPFYKPAWVGSQRVVWINRMHPFYQMVYRDLLTLPGGARTKEGIDAFLIALARAELTVGEHDMKLWYETQRKRRWSPYLDVVLRNIDQIVHGNDAMDEEQQVTADEPEVVK